MPQRNRGLAAGGDRGALSAEVSANQMFIVAREGMSVARRKTKKDKKNRVQENTLKGLEKPKGVRLEREREEK